MTVTSAQVKAIITTSIADTSSFINTATILVNNVLADQGLDSSLVDQITLYLSAHFVCLTEENGGLRRSRLGESDESYKVPGDKDTGLASTRYGQTAMLMDTSGTLAGLSANKGLPALFTVIGDVEDNPDYYENTL